MNKADERAINIFERKILRGIFTAIKEGGHWRRRYNNELYRLYGGQDLVSHIKVGRIRWAGHVARLEDSDPAKQVLESQLYGTREACTPKLRWADGVAQDVKKLEINNWKKAAQDERKWMKLLVETETRCGL
jgi:hypothetical protein